MEGYFKKHKKDINTVFKKAIFNSEYDKVEECLQLSDLDVNLPRFAVEGYRYLENTPLAFAYVQRDLRMFKLLVRDKRTYVNIAVYIDQYAFALLTHLIMNEYQLYVDEMLNHPSIKVNNIHFRVAVKNKRFKTIETLLKRGDVCHFNMFDTLKILINRKIVHFKEKKQILILCIKYGNWEAVNKVLQNPPKRYAKRTYRHNHLKYVKEMNQFSIISKLYLPLWSVKENVFYPNVYKKRIFLYLLILKHKKTCLDMKFMLLQYIATVFKESE